MLFFFCLRQTIQVVIIQMLILNVVGKHSGVITPPNHTNI